MQYAPLVKSMNRVTMGQLFPGYTIGLYDQIVSAGTVQYAFIVAVFNDSTGKPVYFVASEVNLLAGTLGGGSHFLGVFDGQGHANLGDSDDWADPLKFFPKAVELVTERFSPNQPKS